MAAVLDGRHLRATWSISSQALAGLRANLHDLAAPAANNAALGAGPNGQLHMLRDFLRLTGDVCVQLSNLPVPRIAHLARNAST